VFAGEATEIDLLRHGSRFCSALEAVFMKTSTERPVFFSMAWSWRGFAAGSILPLKSQEDDEYSRTKFSLASAYLVRVTGTPLE
jgi:hypothetical protein